MINKFKESIEEAYYFFLNAERKKKIFAALFLLFVLSGIYQSLASIARPMNFLKSILSFSNEDKFIINKEDLSLLPVKVMQIQSRRFTPAISVLGTIEYQDKVALTAKTDGRIEKMYAGVGDKVHKGMLLVQLERLPLQLELNKKIASLAVARADFNLAKREYENARRDIEIKFRDIARKEAIAKELKARLEKSRVTYEGKSSLYQGGGISKEEMELEQINLKSAEAKFRIAKLDYEDALVGFRDKDISRENLPIPREPEKKFRTFVEINTLMQKERVAAAQSRMDAALVDLENLKILLNETSIRSPISGYVAIRNKGVGEEVKGGSASSLDQAIMVLVDINQVYARLNLKESELKIVSVGMNVEFSLDFYPGKKFKSRLSSINPIVNESTHTVEVKAILKNYDKILKPGMFIRAKIALEQARDMIMVPSTALVPRAKNNAYVFKVRDRKALKTDVVTGKEFDEKVEITGGLTEGEVIVIEKLSQMQDNLGIKPVSSAAE